MNPIPPTTTDSTPRLKLILMGTGPFAVPAFEALVDAGHEVSLVVTRPAAAVRSRRGQPPAPVREFAAARNLPLEDPASVNTPEAIARLQALAPDLLVVCDFGQILSAAALSVARLGGINLHGSLLPAFRGAAPVQRALLAGEPVTGVSIIHMTPKLDGGPILAALETPIRLDETAGELEHRLAELGVEPTLASVRMLAAWDGHSPIGTPQDPKRVSLAPRLHKEEGRIDWRRTAEQVDWHVRGMSPWPGAYTEVAIEFGKPPLRISVRQITVIERESLFPSHEFPTTLPGMLIDASQFTVATGRGVIRIDRLQAAGRGEVTGAEFLRGYRLQTGTRLGGEPETKSSAG